MHQPLSRCCRRHLNRRKPPKKELLIMKQMPNLFSCSFSPLAFIYFVGNIISNELEQKYDKNNQYCTYKNNIKFTTLEPEEVCIISESPSTDDTCHSRIANQINRCHGNTRNERRH